MGVWGPNLSTTSIPCIGSSGGVGRHGNAATAFNDHRVRMIKESAACSYPRVIIFVKSLGPLRRVPDKSMKFGAAGLSLPDRTREDDGEAKCAFSLSVETGRGQRLHHEEGRSLSADSKVSVGSSHFYISSA